MEVHMVRKLQVTAAVAVVALLCTQAAFAQLGTTQDISASANVYSAISLTGVTADVAFSNIQTNVNPFVDPTGAASTNVGTSAAAGTFTVNGSTGAAVQVTFSGQGTLTDGGANSMKFTPSVTVGATQGSSTSYTSGNSVTLTSGTAVFWVGGTLYATDGSSVVPSAQAAGSYSTGSAGGSAVTFTIDYVL